MKHIITFVACCLASVCVYGVDAYLTMENDCFLVQQDNDYSHGTGLKIVDDRWHYSVNQNMYTPSDLRVKEHIKGDRPYCGMLIGGIGYEFVNDPLSPWTHYGEINFGVIGPSAGCKQTQKFIHKILDCKDPKGWDNQLHDEFVVNGQWWTKYNYYVTDWLAIVPRAGVAVGTIQDMAEIGCDIKLGYNMRHSVGNDILFSASSPDSRSWLDKLSCYVFAGCGERYYLYNHILEGSMFGHKDDGLDVDIEPFVTELRGGIVVQYGKLYLSWYGIWRTREFEHQKHHPDYGGICLGYSF